MFEQLPESRRINPEQMRALIERTALRIADALERKGLDLAATHAHYRAIMSASTQSLYQMNNRLRELGYNPMSGLSWRQMTELRRKTAAGENYDTVLDEIVGGNAIAMITDAQRLRMKVEHLRTGEDWVLAAIIVVEL